MDTIHPLDRDRLGWWVIALAFGLFVLYLLYSFLGTFVFGVFVYYATRPIYRRVNQIVGHPSLSAGVSLLAIILPALLLAFYTIAIALQELNKFLESGHVTIRPLESLLQPYFDISAVISDPASLLTQPNATVAIRAVLREAAAYLGFFGTAALHLLVVIILAFYLLRDDRRLADWWRHRFSDQEGVMAEYMTRVDRDLSKVLFGNILNALLTGIIGAIAYGLLNLVTPATVGVPYPTLLGMLAGVASLIPILGIKIVYVPMGLYLFVKYATDPSLLWFPILFAVVSAVIVDVIPDLILRPYVSGRTLHLGMVMLAYIFGPLLFGWYGLFFGPIVLVLLVHFVVLVLPELLAGSPIRPEAVPDPLASAGSSPNGSGPEGEEPAAAETAETAEEAGTE
ncbi:MAG: AI-2E family transporter [Halodesulfurarchaeum sp.]